MRLFYSFCILVFTAATVSAQMADVEVLTPFDFATNFRDVHVESIVKQMEEDDLLEKVKVTQDVIERSSCNTSRTFKNNA